MITVAGIKNLTLDTLDELPSAARQLVDFGKTLKIWIFRGEMGAGKTTLIKSVCRELKVIDQVSSPTFSLVNEYLTEDDELIYHFDFYRIADEAEALNIGVNEYFYSGSLCLIEWPEKIPGLIPEKNLEVGISVSGNKRTLQLFKHEN